MPCEEMKRSPSACLHSLCTAVCDRWNLSPPHPPLSPSLFFIFNSPSRHLNPSHSIKTFHFCPLPSMPTPPPTTIFPPSPPPSSHLQVVKWILLSRSHQGKKRKRKKTEPKVNSKEVGDANFLPSVSPVHPPPPSPSATSCSSKSTPSHPHDHLPPPAAAAF